MFFRKIIILMLFAGVMAGCAASSQKTNHLRLGMLKSEVIQVMGDPDYVAARDDVEVLNYKLTSDGLFKDDFIVRIKNGKVDLFGQRYDFSAPY